MPIIQVKIISGKVGKLAVFWSVASGRDILPSVLPPSRTKPYGSANY